MTPEKIPAKLDCEKALLGSLLLDPSRISEATSVVTSADFFDPQYAILFSAFVTLHDAGRLTTDLIRGHNELVAMSIPPEVASVAFLAALLDHVPTAANAKFYAQQIRKAARLRFLDRFAVEVRQRANERDADPEKIGEWLNTIASAMREQTAGEPRTMQVVADEVLHDLYARRATASEGRGIYTGLPSLDRVMGPILPGEYAILAARPGRGKTSFGLQIACHNQEKGRQGLYVSLEMRDRELVTRKLCELSGVESRAIRTSDVTDDDMERLTTARNDVSDSLLVYDPPKATLSQIRGVAHLTKAKHGLSLVVVDYIGLIKSSQPGRPKWEAIGEISQDLKVLAKELDCAVLVLCQLGREAESSKPTLSNLRDSGSIEQDADIVLFSHWATDSQENAQDAELIIAKHRHGETGLVNATFLKNETRFIQRDYGQNQFAGHNNGSYDERMF